MSSRELVVNEITYNPLHHQVKEDLREKIVKGIFPSRTFLPTERKLTVIYRISRGTVRQALNELEREGYVSSHQGRGTMVIGTAPAPAVKPQIQTRNIGFLFGWERSVISTAPYYSAVYAAVEREAVAHNRRIMFVSSSMVGRKPAVSWFRQNFDGLLISELTDAALVRTFAHERFPFVLVNCSAEEGIKVNSVVIDNTAAAFSAVQYLVGLGHKRIALIYEGVNGYDNPVYLERLKGYQLALTQNGIACDKCLVVREQISRHDIFRRESPELLRMLKRAKPRPTAIFACNDLIATEAIAALRGAGLAVPSDMSVVGFDDIEAARETLPPLTTMRVDTEKMGSTAVRRLLSLIGVEKASAPREIIIPTKLVIRESTRELG